MGNDLQRRGSETRMAPAEKLKAVLAAGSVQEQFRNALGEAAPLFAASVLDAFSSGGKIQNCEPKDIVREALKAAVLRLPLSRGLSLAYIVPRKDHGMWAPQMQVGWRGWVQLAQRSGQYKSINAGPVFAGEKIVSERLSGHLALEGEPSSAEVVGFFAHFALLNGFEKALYWPLAKVRAHRDRYAQGHKEKWSAWQTHFDEMAIKSVLSNLLRNFGPLSVEMQQATRSEDAGHDAGANLLGAPEKPAEQIPMKRATVAKPKPAAKPPTPAPRTADPDAPPWIELLREKQQAYLAAHAGQWPADHPEEITSEKVASEWIAWFAAQAATPACDF